MARQTQKKATAKKKTLTKRAPLKDYSTIADQKLRTRQIVNDQLKLSHFQIDLNPPMPVRGNREETSAIITILENTLKTVPAGAAFLIATIKKATISRYLKTTYPKELWRFYTIPDNPDFTRVYRMRS